MSQTTDKLMANVLKQTQRIVPRYISIKNKTQINVNLIACR